MSPHGLDNPEPLFCTRGRLGRERAPRWVAASTCKLVLVDGTARAEAIGFGLGNLAASLSRARRCDVAYSPTRNEWMGETRMQLKVKGVKLP